MGEIMEDNEFARQSKEAVEKMREMNSRAVGNKTKQNMPPVPPFVHVQSNRQNTPPQNQRQNTAAPKMNKPETNKNENKNTGILSGLNIPFLDMLSGDADVSLIIGLLLILMSEKADKKLLFALIYILL